MPPSCRCSHHITNFELLRFFTEGRVISKWFLGISVPSKKRTNEFVFTSMPLVFVRFLEEIDDLKKPFRNQVTFKTESFE